MEVVELSPGTDWAPTQLASGKPDLAMCMQLGMVTSIARPMMAGNSVQILGGLAWTLLNPMPEDLRPRIQATMETELRLGIVQQTPNSVRIPRIVQPTPNSERVLLIDPRTDLRHRTDLLTPARDKVSPIGLKV